MLVLGIDALDYRKVGDFNNLKLICNGSMEVPVNARVKQPLSPEVWRAFLTGEETKVDFTGQSKAIQLLEYVKARFPVKVKLGLAKHFKQAIDYPARDFDSFIEELGFLEINAPYYSLDFPRLTSTTAKWMGGGMDGNEFQSWLYDEMTSEKDKVLAAKDRGVLKPVFAYFPQLDTVQHCFWRHPTIITEWYGIFDQLVFQLQPDLIVSDHGAENGMHSMLGYWACTRDIAPKNITDFRQILRGWVNE